MNNQAWARIPHNQARKSRDWPPRLIAGEPRCACRNWAADAKQVCAAILVLLSVRSHLGRRQRLRGAAQSRGRPSGLPLIRAAPRGRRGSAVQGGRQAVVAGDREAALDGGGAAS